MKNWTIAHVVLFCTVMLNHVAKAGDPPALEAERIQLEAKLPPRADNPQNGAPPAGVEILTGFECSWRGDN